VFLLSRWERAVWSAIEMTSSVDLLAVFKLEWLEGFWDNGVEVIMVLLLKALHGYRRECYGSVVI
jgi:hypothetical protein